jgi:hypothetical protein
MRSGAIVALAVALVTTAAMLGALALEGVGAGRAPPPLLDPRKSNMDVADAQRFPDFPLYSLGDAFDVLPLTSIQRVEQERALPGEEGAPKANFVAFGYGDCEPEPCAIPVDVQVWAACERNPSVYRVDPAGRIPLASERLTVRGVPATYFPADPRLELSTSAVTVVIFAADRAQVLAAAAALRGVNRGVRAAEPLPAPTPGATDGKLRCAE